MSVTTRGRRLAPALLLVLGTSASQEPPVYRDLDGTAAGDAPFAIIGDTQETMFWEKVIGRESNPAERRQLFAELERLRPAFLVIAGDVVSAGASAARWRYFDGLSSGLREAGVPILPALGNHDYWGSNTDALRNVSARFPQLAAGHWYLRRYGRLALVFLDANHDDLGAAAWTTQQRWLDSALTACDEDTSISGVLLIDHQPPYTNGTTTHDDAHVQAAFVPAFAAHRKTLALISGHTHAFEHFVKDGKHYIVSGGGGGPRVKLKTGTAHQDLFTGPSPRPYHFLWMTPDSTGVRIEVRGFDRGETTFRTISSFTLP